MQTADRFHLCPDSTILTPDVSGMSGICAALLSGWSLGSRQTGATPVVTIQEPRQWLRCETAGSSGTAKTIRRSPASWIASFEQNRDMFGLSKSARYAALGHLGHSLTLYATLEALHIGADLALLWGRSPRAQMQALRTFAINTVFATPTQLALLCKATDGPVPSVALVMCGGGKLQTALRDQLDELFPNSHVVEFFGASETSFVTLADATAPASSVGQVYPNVSLRIGAGNTAFQVGEIWVQSPYLCEDYDGALSGQIARDGAAISLLEMGYLDESGYLFLMGRKNRMVTIADTNIFPEAIETLLNAHPEVTMSAALPVPDILRGQRMVAVVEAQASDRLQTELRQICRQTLGGLAVPKSILFVDHLPLLPAGKPDLAAAKRILEATHVS